ncbi:MAG: ABC transporter substrate-binding protein [Deltaproteobacteria bacterium]|nr:ABC transporter substrate-binding protein [Deltaproteobacteria bacterium]MBT4526001.1 ABC transporter substrate-binding protein [Deltaproteobacteria bacterium]
MKYIYNTLLILLSLVISTNAYSGDWETITKNASGQTVYFNAWGGSDIINDYIRWAGDQVQSQYGIKVKHVKVTDIGDVISRILAEKSAGRNDSGSVDLMWINGENFRAMKDNLLLYGPFTQKLPNYRLVDTENKPTVLSDFTTKVDHMEAPWGMAQLIFMYDSAQVTNHPKNMPDLLIFAKKHPGKVTYPAPPSFYGTTFIKQVMLELVEDKSPLYDSVKKADFENVTAPLWKFLDQLHPLMWRKGKAFTSGAPEMKQLLNDGEIFISLSFNPNDASNAIDNGELPDSIRTYIHQKGTIGNTHFVGIPFNSSAKEGAMVFANFLMSPEAQLRKSIPQIWGDPTVLNINKLSSKDRVAFSQLPLGIATLTAAELNKVMLEPDASWVAALEKAWQRRYQK